VNPAEPRLLCLPPPPLFSHQHASGLLPQVAEALQQLPGAAFDDPGVSSSAQAFAHATLSKAAQQHVPGLAPRPVAAPDGAIGNCMAGTVNATVGVHHDARDEQPACIAFVRSGGSPGRRGGAGQRLGCEAGGEPGRG
jgi:hypothetical protein